MLRGAEHRKRTGEREHRRGRKGKDGKDGKSRDQSVYLWRRVALSAEGKRDGPHDGARRLLLASAENMGASSVD